MNSPAPASPAGPAPDDGLVEAVARAICTGQGYDPDAPSDGPGYEVPTYMHDMGTASLVVAALRAHTAQPAAGALEVMLQTEYGTGVEAAYLEGFEDGWDQRRNDIWPFDKAQTQGWEDSQMRAALNAAPGRAGPEKWRKDIDRLRHLVKAGALILAEIERLDRAAAPQPEEPK